jgi:hypothetical protein
MLGGFPGTRAYFWCMVARPPRAYVAARSQPRIGG